MAKVRGLQRALQKIKGLAGRCRNYNPALYEIAERHKVRQREHWGRVQQTPFSPNSFRIYSEGRQGYPTPGTFATATGTLRDRLQNGVRVDEKERRIVVDPMMFGNSHPTASTFREVVDTQEQFQREKGAGSLTYSRNARQMGENAAIVVRYIVGDWGK